MSDDYRGAAYITILDTFTCRIILYNKEIHSVECCICPIATLNSSRVAP